MDTLPETSDFDLGSFVENLRQLSVEDAKRYDKEHIDERDGIEFFAYPEGSPKCVLAVAEALKKHSDSSVVPLGAMSNKIIRSVDAFLARSMGLDKIKIDGVNGRPRDLQELYYLEVRRGNFWREVTAMLAGPTKNILPPEIEQTGSDTATAVKGAL